MRMPMRRTLLTALTTEALTGYGAKIAAIAQVRARHCLQPCMSAPRWG
jgi:hypothetical protein